MRLGHVKSTCPRCHSENTKQVEYMGISCIVCGDCGYDERKLYEVYPEGRTSQGEKGRFSPYKAGGSRRSAKR